MTTAANYTAAAWARGQITPADVAELVRAWQAAHGLDPDGKAGPLTRGSWPWRATTATPAPASFPAQTPSALGLRALEVAVGELGRGEIGGNNSGADVARYHGIADDGDDDDDGAWCAAFVGWCYQQAAGGRDALPFKRSGGAKVLFQRVAAAGARVRYPAPGDVVCWHRGDPKGWQGHIGIVEHFDGALVHTIEGNTGRYPSKVRRLVRDFADPNLVGFARAP